MNRSEIEKITLEFTKLFNDEDLNAVLSYFSDDAVYVEFNGTKHKGIAAIRAAFEPQFGGRFGKMTFYTEDLLIDPETQKSLIRWTLTLEEEERQGAYRGLDILFFIGKKIVQKHTYCKAKVPLINKKSVMISNGTWPKNGSPGK